MSAEFSDLAERASSIPLLSDDETLDSLVIDFKRIVVKSVLDRHVTAASAAKELGMTREGLWKLRKRLGLDVPSQAKPIPDDWRERLEAAVRASP